MSEEKKSDLAARKPWSTPKVIVSTDMHSSEKNTYNDGDQHVTSPVDTHHSGS